MTELIEIFLQPLRSQLAQVLIIAAFILTVLDVLFGVGNAVIHHEFSSKKMREGIGHKSTSVGAILVGCVIDATISAGIELGYPAPVLASVCSYICLMEIASLLETFGKLNPQFRDSPLYQLLAAAHVMHESEVTG